MWLGFFLSLPISEGRQEVKINKNLIRSGMGPPNALSSSIFAFLHSLFIKSVMKFSFRERDEVKQLESEVNHNCLWIPNYRGFFISTIFFLALEFDINSVIWKHDSISKERIMVRLKFTR